jgi:hypothetical protein
MTIDWTEDEARSAEAGAETDQRCARVMGWTTEAGTPIREGDDVAPSQRVSRTAEGAHQAREWLRGEGFDVRMRLRDEAWRQPSITMAAFGDRHGFVSRSAGWVNAKTEHLATARLVLVLAAKGVLDD